VDTAIGASYSPSSSTIVKAIVNKGFRNPTIREMYMFPTQNPNLKPERLMNYEVSLLQSFPRQQLSFGLNLFYIRGSNMIQVDVVEGKPLNVNSGKVEIRESNSIFTTKQTVTCIFRPITVC